MMGELEASVVFSEPVICDHEAEFMNLGYGNY